jgi:hypothetical protein
MFGKILKLATKAAVALGLVDKLKDKLGRLIDRAAKKTTKDLFKQVDKANRARADLKTAIKLLK